ncbi:MAG: S-layer family protein [Cyanothece sp. SIO1E1]|nr:S-layer family protein [Cyanothece sp. SIO1E1]
MSLLPLPALGQITADGILSTTVTTADNLNFVINDGDRAGNNLFHSFQGFSIPTGGSALFNHGVEVQNVIGRVTGPSASSIDGLIQANGTADLFLINPNGLLFGPNATLAIGGSLIGSTASSLRFADGSQFSAVNPQNSALLTISTPIGLQSGPNPGNIVVQGTGNNLTRASRLEIDSTNRPVGLQIQPNQTLALIGGDIQLAGGNLTAAGGRIELGAVASDSSVSLTPVSNGWEVGYENVQNFRDIHLSEAASVDTSAAGAGSLRVQGRTISLAGGSALLALTQGSAPGQNVNVTASESIELSGANGNSAPSLITTEVNLGATGDAGDLTLETGQLLLRDGALITSSPLGNGGNGGNLTIRAAEVVELSGLNRFGSSSMLSTEVVSSEVTGDAGDLTIETNRVLIRDGGIITTATSGRGNAGNLVIRAAESIDIAGLNADGIPGFLATQVTPFGIGNAGNLSVETGTFLIQDGAAVSALTAGQGNAGNLVVRARDRIEITGVDGTGAGGQLVTDVFPRAIGNAGTLLVETGRLILEDGANVQSVSFGQGAAGNLTIRATESVELRQASENGVSSRIATGIAAAALGDAGDLTIATQDLILEDGTLVTALTFGQGNAGDISISATGLIELSGINPAGSSSRIATLVTPRAQGNAGSLSLKAQQLVLHDQAEITSETLGTGNASDLMIQVSDGIFVTDGSTISAQTAGGGRAGNLTVTAGELVVQNQGQLLVDGQGEFPAGTLTILADSIRLDSQGSVRAETEAGDRGNITLQAQDLILLNRGSEIITNAVADATGGDITIDTPILVLLEESGILAQAIAGRGGNIKIATQGLFQLSGSRLDPSSVLGIDGVVEITTPDTNPIQQIVELPTELIDSTQLIARSCLTPSNRRSGQFVITGAGGLPVLPENPANATFETYTVPLDNENRFSGASRPQLITSERPPSPSLSLPLEAEGIYRLENGGLMLGRECG